ncbi:MAG: type IV pilus assembly protein PilM [Planctomycetota bacterium]
MAKSGAVWGIDIGQCALKALRCRPHEKDTNRIVVEAFDYIEYPKLLSQQDADREELIAEALETFLSRNEVKGDSIAIAVPGQSGLARFIKLPPVESKKIPDIVKYEAKQQIPFALEDVVWDYEPLAGGSQDEGYALETEVGLFAMKRDQVARALEPLENAGIEVDTIQLAPLSVYNYAAFDRLNNLEDAEEFDPENQPPSIALFSFGAESTDLVVTNGYRVWQRNIPLGGSHFTKRLAKEMRITFAKAEHLKRNATQAEDPKAVFQAMRPVFSDLVTEIQRSLRFYESNNKASAIKEIIALGNPMKLPGLQRYLAQNLEQPVTPIEEFRGLVGGSVTAAPQFKDNHLSFAVAYGLCVQGLGLSQLSTNLLPEEIITKRLVRSKKPWMVAAAAMLMVGLAINYSSYVSSWQTVDIEDDWSSPINSSKSLTSTAGRYTSRDQELRDKFNQIEQIGNNLQSNTDGRLLWLELLKAVDAAVPVDERPEAERKKTATDVSMREELHIESIEVQKFESLDQWFSGSVKQQYLDALKSEELSETAAAAEAAAAGEGEGGEGGEEGGDENVDPDAVDDGEAPAEDQFDDQAGGQDDFDNGGFDDEFSDEGGADVQGPTGEGWVVQLIGYHFHNSSADDPDNKVGLDDEGARFVRKTLIKNLLQKTVMLPDGQGGELVEVPLSKLGVSYPVLVTSLPIFETTYDPNAQDDESNQGGARRARPAVSRFGGPGARGGAEGAEAEQEPELWKLRRYDFIVQFVWKPTPRTVRINGDAAGEAETYDDF